MECAFSEICLGSGVENERTVGGWVGGERVVNG